ANEAMGLGRFEEAQRLADEAAKNWPEDVQAQKFLKSAQRQLETAQTAQAAYLRYAQAGALAMTGNRYADAVAAYTEALRLAPLDLEIQRSLRAARVALEQDLRIRLEYDRLIKAGTLALQQRSFPDAVKLFRDARKLIPGDLVATDGLSKAR